MLTYFFLTLLHVLALHVLIGAAQNCNGNVNGTRFDNVLMYRLYSYLQTGYNADVRPVVSHGQPTVVSLKLHLQDLNGVDIQTQQLKQSLYLDVTWKDEFYVWNPRDFGGVEAVFVKQEDIWVPDLTVEQLVGDSTAQMGDVDLLLQVFSDGTVNWAPDLNIATACDVDITYYPYDTQVCEFRIHSWVMNDRSLVLAPPLGVSGVFGRRARLNAQWQILDVVNATCDFEDLSAVTPEMMSCVSYRYTVKRRALFLSLTLVTPTVLLALLSPMVFFMPAEEGEKMSLSTTLLLTFFLILSILMDVLPMSSLQTSVFMIYLVLHSAMSALSVVCTSLTLYIYYWPHDIPLTRPAFRLVRFLVNRGYLRVSGAKPRGPVAEWIGHLPVLLQLEISHSIPGCIYGEDNANSHHRPGSAQQLAAEEDGGESDAMYGGDPERPRRRKKKKSRLGAVSWRDVSLALDFVFFYLFLLVVVVSTLVCFVVLGVGNALPYEESQAFVGDT